MGFSPQLVWAEAHTSPGLQPGPALVESLHDFPPRGVLLAGLNARMNGMRWTIAALAAPVCLLAQDASSDPKPTAVYTVADQHTSRWTDDKDPLVKIKGACDIGSSDPPRSVSCASPPVSEPRTGRRHFYSVVLFRDLDENHYLAACASAYRNTACEDLRAGRTFSAEVEGQTIRLVIHDTQLPLRILEFRRHPVTTTEGTPTHARPTPGSASVPSWSRASEARGTPSNV